MSRKQKVELVAGKSICFDFDVEGDVISYEMVCPNCKGKKFIISLDKTRVACVRPDCLSVLCVRLRDTADINNVTWKV